MTHDEIFHKNLSFHTVQQPVSQTLQKEIGNVDMKGGNTSGIIFILFFLY